MQRVGILFATSLGMALAIIGVFALLWQIRPHFLGVELGVAAFGLLGALNYAATVVQLLRLRRDLKSTNPKSSFGLET
jgi:hypothetical protein